MVFLGEVWVRFGVVVEKVVTKVVAKVVLDRNGMEYRVGAVRV